MRIEQLEYLTMVSKCTSLTEASERLFITQQSLGRAIRDLEEELGVSLLVRNNRGCMLTKEGHETLEQGREILERVDRLQNYFVKKETVLKGKLVVLCTQVMFADELPLALEWFTKQYPDVEVTAMEKDSFYMPKLQEQLLKQDHVFVVSILHMPQERRIGMGRIPDNFQFYPFYKTRWVACMNQRHRLSKQKKIAMEELLKEKLIVSSPDYPEMGLDSAMLCCYGEPNVKRTVSNLELFYNVLEETDDLIGVIPDILLRYKRVAVPRTLICRDLNVKMCSSIGYLVEKQQSNQPIVRMFLQYLEEAMEQMANRSQKERG